MITPHHAAQTARMRHTTRKLIPIVAVALVAGLAATIKVGAGLSPAAGLGLLIGLALVVIPVGVWFAFGPYVTEEEWKEAQWREAVRAEIETGRRLRRKRKDGPG